MASRALITGGSAGLGKALVSELTAMGWQVISIDLNRPKKIEGYEHVSCNLSDRKQIDKLPMQLAKYGPFDLVIFNAGISATGKFEEMPFAAYEKLIRLNAEGPMVLSGQLVQAGLMTEQSHLAFISSLSHFTGYPGAAVYAASKDAIAIYAKSIVKPFRQKGIKVSCVFPGPLRTEHAERHSPSGSSDANRMTPEQAASIILKDIRAGKTRIFPGAGAKMAASAGKILPSALTYAMRKALFEKLDKNTY